MHNWGFFYAIGEHEIMKEVQNYKEDNSKYKSFKKALEELYTVDWTETDGSDVENILKNNLLGGISVHKGYWLELVEKETSLNQFQKYVLKNTILMN